MIYQHIFSMLKRKRILADVRRDRFNAEDIRGFIVGFSKDFLAIEAVSDDIYLDGIRIVRCQDITFLRWQTEVQRNWQSSLNGSRKKRAPNLSPLRVDLRSWESIIKSIQKIGGLITFHRENLDTTTCYIAKEVETTGGVVAAEQVSSEGIINGNFCFAIDDITRIDFQGSYELGLSRILKSSASAKEV